MKLCIMCDKIQRNPQHFVETAGRQVVVCEEHKNTDPNKICSAIALMLVTVKTGIESWDYLWQGPGQT